MRVLLALALVFCLTAQAWAGETLDRVRKTGVFTNLVVSDYPPFGFINDQNELDGFDVDVARAVAGRLGVTLKLAPKVPRDVLVVAESGISAPADLKTWTWGSRHKRGAPRNERSDGFRRASTTGAATTHQHSP